MQISRTGHQPVPVGMIVITGTEIEIGIGLGTSKKDPGIVNGNVNGTVACQMHLPEARHQKHKPHQPLNVLDQTMG